MVWYILLGIVALLVLILGTPLSLTVALDESGELSLVGRVLGIAVYRSPKKERPVRLSDYSPRALRRRQKREENKRRRAAAKARRRQSSQKKTDALPDKKVALTEKIVFIKELISAVLGRTLHHARVDVESLAITVATPDAATTAILYGGVCGALAGLTELLNQASHLRIRDASRYGVAADFTAEKTKADVRIHLRVRLLHALDIGICALGRLTSRMLKKQK